MHFDEIRNALLTVRALANDHGVVEIDSGKPGPVIAVTALTHGNEISGILTVNTVLSHLDSAELTLDKGKLLILLANDQILQDASGFEELIRHRGVDLNRIWAESMQPPPDGTPGSAEYAVRDRLLPYLAQADTLIDLHSTSLKSTPIGILLADSTETGQSVCDVLRVPYVLTNIDEYLNGCAMIMRHRQLVSERAKPPAMSFSIVIEAGQHFDFATVQNNVENVIALLQTCGVVAGNPRQVDDKPLRLNVYQVGLAESAGPIVEWIYTENPAGFDAVPAGTHVCNFHGKPVHASHDSFIVMPQLAAVNAGQEIFYLAAAV